MHHQPAHSSITTSSKTQPTSFYTLEYIHTLHSPPTYSFHIYSKLPYKLLHSYPTNTQKPHSTTTTAMPLITEPSPSLPPTRLYHAGRGGAGNYHRLPTSTTTLPQPPTSTIPSYSASHNFFSGRGGSGNVHSPSERTIFSFDEELERDRIMADHQAPVYSVGRGGAGNIVPNPAGTLCTRTTTRGSVESDRSNSSAGSTDSAVYGVERLMKGIKRVSSRRSQQ